MRRLLGCHYTVGVSPELSESPSTLIACKLTSISAMLQDWSPLLLKPLHFPGKGQEDVILKASHCIAQVHSLRRGGPALPPPLRAPPGGLTPPQPRPPPPHPGGHPLSSLAALPRAFPLPPLKSYHALFHATKWDFMPLVWENLLLMCVSSRWISSCQMPGGWSTKIVLLLAVADPQTSSTLPASALNNKK